jgi:hypothetical protein
MWDSLSEPITKQESTRSERAAERVLSELDSILGERLLDWDNRANSPELKRCIRAKVADLIERVTKVSRFQRICEEQAAQIKNLERQLRAHEGYWTCAGCGIEFGPEVEYVSHVDEYLCVDCDIADEAERENPEL